MKVTELTALGAEAEIMEILASPPSEAAGRAELDGDWQRHREGTGKGSRHRGTGASMVQGRGSSSPGHMLAGGSRRLWEDASRESIIPWSGLRTQHTASSRVLLAPGIVQGQSPEASAVVMGARREGCSSASPESCSSSMVQCPNPSTAVRFAWDGPNPTVPTCLQHS